MKNQSVSYPIDNSAILFLSQMEKQHTNTFRYQATMDAPVDPETLQQAADRVFSRFPTIYAGIRRSAFEYRIVPVEAAPRVCRDPGLLKVMPEAEMADCAYRIFWQDNRISIEAFHALTDGYGSTTAFRTLLAEYLYLSRGIDSPERQQMLHSGQPDYDAELRDSYLDYATHPPRRPPGRMSYQADDETRNWEVKADMETFSTRQLLAASRSLGVSMTVLLSTLMAEAIMELQLRREKKILLPVRIMVPMDLRRMFPSRTLRNFVLYALPELRVRDWKLPLKTRLTDFQKQIKAQTSREPLAAMLAANVAAQKLLLYRIVPLRLKCLALSIGYRFFGECNSSITLTNLGPVALSEVLKPHIRRMDVLLTPRRRSPHNCGIITVEDVTSIALTRFGESPALAELFFGKLKNVLNP